MKKADLDDMCDTTGTHDCRKCGEFDICDNCGRRVCTYVSVCMDSDDEIWCRVCCREVGFSEKEIKSQRCELT